MSPRPTEADFGIEIDFRPGSDAPSRVFRTMTGLIEAFESVDKELVRSVARIQPILLLEDIEAGSIRTWLRTQLETLDDGTLKSGEWKKVVGIFLVKAKYIMVDFLEDHSTITNKAEIESLQAKILSAAEETNVLAIPTYRPIPMDKVADAIRLIGEATQTLKSPDSARYLSDAGNANFNLTFSIAPQAFDELVTRETITNQSTMILKVKKPDFLGESMWEFKYENRTIEAKFLDLPWLQKFRERSITLRPGDAIKASVETEVRYSVEGDVIFTVYKILAVYELISVEGSTQNGLFGV
jgi:hypothetical protein